MLTFSLLFQPLQAIIASNQDEYADDDGEVRSSTRSFYVLSGNTLNKWQVASVGPEKLLYHVDAGRLVRESLARRVWEKDSHQLPQVKHLLNCLFFSTMMGFQMLSGFNHFFISPFQ